VARLADTFGVLADQLAPGGPIGSRIVAGLEQVFTRVDAFLKSVDIEALTARLLEFWEGAKVVFGVLSAGFSEVATIFNAVGTFLGEAVASCYLFVDAVGTALGEGAAKLFLAGEELGGFIWKGLTEGILGGLGRVGDAVGELAFGAVSKVKNVLGIQSPSRVFMEMGAMTGEGYAKGVEGSKSRIDRVVDQTVGLSAPSASLRPQSMSGGPISISVPITVHYSGAENGNAEEIAGRIRDLVPGQLQSAFEQLRLEMGAA
jgi:phage-related protein